MFREAVGLAVYIKWTMDKNKLKKLQNISYVVCKTCEICLYGNFKNASSMFGECQLCTYLHLKHTNRRRNLSITRSGHCHNFVLSDGKAAILDDYINFIG